MPFESYWSSFGEANGKLCDKSKGMNNNKAMIFW